MEKQTTLIQLQSDDYDWESAFELAGEVVHGHNSANLCTLPGETTSLEPFKRADIVELWGAVEGENDGLAWLAYGRLKDDRCFYLEAGCDYTGWD